MSTVAARHAEIARRYKFGKGERAPVSLAALRTAQLRRLFTARYGHVLPDDDAGRDDALIMVHHLANRPDAERQIGSWLTLWAPWMTSSEAAILTAKVLGKPLRWRADTLANLLHLTEAERHRLRITTIGACDLTKAERLGRRRLHARLRKQERRRAAGAKPRVDYEANSISRTKPWEMFQMSRASWYRAGKPTA
jgi:hypothetical protein